MKCFLKVLYMSTYKVRLMDKLGCSSLLELYDFAQRNKIG